MPVTRSSTFAINLSAIFSGPTLSTVNIFLTSKSYKIVPCCKRIPFLRVCAFPETFFPSKMMSLIGLNSAFKPSKAKASIIHPQITRYDSIMSFGNNSAGAITL